MTENPAKARWIDTTLNLQTLLVGIVGVCATTAIAYFTLVGRVSTLEDHDRQQEQHFARIEGDMQQQRADVKEQLRSISSDVKDTNTKIDQLRDQLLQNSVGNRPDAKRWAR